MTRNKHPEQTVAKILDTSLQLFAKKGYEKTTIQDIVDELGMSKGAIYHHFNSKKEILDAMGDHYYNISSDLASIMKRRDLNGLEKLRELLHQQVDNGVHHGKSEMDIIMLNMWKDPYLFMMNMKENLTVDSKQLEPILLEGMRDGSIRKQDVSCAVQVLLLLLNCWLFSPLTGFDFDHFRSKLHYLREICVTIGIPVIDDALEEKAYSYFKRLAANV